MKHLSTFIDEYGSIFRWRYFIGSLVVGALEGLVIWYVFFR